LLIGPVPLATAIATAGAVTGPLLLAEGNVVAGIALTIIGLPIAWLIVRSLDALSHRWVVLVPAGIVIVDPLMLLDPVLVRREVVVRVHEVPGRSRPNAVLDLRLGTLAGGVEIVIDPPATFGRRRGRTDTQLVEPGAVVVAMTRPRALLNLASRRRLPAS